MHAGCLRLVALRLALKLEGTTMISSNDLRPGVTVEYRDGAWQVIEAYLLVTRNA